MILLFVAFIKYIPKMLSAGNKIGTIKDIFSATFRLKLGITNENASLFVLYPIIISKINARLNEMKREVIDNGVS